jgi:hypothetical protein
MTKMPQTDPRQLWVGWSFGSKLGTDVLERYKDLMDRFVDILVTREC